MYINIIYISYIYYSFRHKLRCCRDILGPWFSRHVCPLERRQLLLRDRKLMPLLLSLSHPPYLLWLLSLVQALIG